jgi:hypothetical protein
MFLIPGADCCRNPAHIVLYQLRDSPQSNPFQCRISASGRWNWQAILVDLAYRFIDQLLMYVQICSRNNSGWSVGLEVLSVSCSIHGSEPSLAACMCLDSPERALLTTTCLNGATVMQAYACKIFRHILPGYPEAIPQPTLIQMGHRALQATSGRPEDISSVLEDVLVSLPLCAVPQRYGCSQDHEAAITLAQEVLSHQGTPALTPAFSSCMLLTPMRSCQVPHPQHIQNCQQDGLLPRGCLVCNCGLRTLLLPPWC